MLDIWGTMVGCRVRNREDMTNKRGKADINSIRRVDKDNGRVGSIHISHSKDRDKGLDGDGSNEMSPQICNEMTDHEITLYSIHVMSIYVCSFIHIPSPSRNPVISYMINIRKNAKRS